MIKQEKASVFGLQDVFNYVYTERPSKVHIDLQHIKSRGKLVALTTYSNSSYFIYKGTPMGFDYELLQHLAEHLKVKLEIILVNNPDELYEKLNSGQGDLIADHLTISKEKERIIHYTSPYSFTKQVLVQRIPHGNQKPVRTAVDLIGKKVHVRKNSPYHKRLIHLQEEIGGDIEVVEVASNIDVEDLIIQVSEGKIDYTVADEHIAMVNQAYLSNLDISTPVSMEQRLAWAVRTNSPELLNAVNAWIVNIQRDNVYGAVYNKYFKNKRGAHQMVACRRNMSCKKTISSYDQLVKKFAGEINWDWRLLSALIYQESNFNPEAKSWAGATGLMQLMPATAEMFGAMNIEDPVENLRAGIKYLAWLDIYWKSKVPDKEERLKFILASYNAGQEHVADAQRLAEKYNRNPQVWDDNVAWFILQKSKTIYNTDPVVKYGYCRGSETFNYVNQILDRYNHYKKLINEEA